MRPVNFKYEKVGHIIMLEEDDWNRIVEYLAKVGVRVDEASLTKRSPDARKSAPKKRSKNSKGSATYGNTLTFDWQPNKSVEPTECTECGSRLPDHFAGCSRFPN